MKFRNMFLGAFGALGLSIGSAVAAVLVVDGSGQLTGATAVDVGGTLYDVGFVEGSCVDLFDGCDEPTDFVFRDDGAKANLAAQALMDQVFVDSAAGPFDSNPNLTFGCGDFEERCTVYTLWKNATLNVSDVYNFSGATPDFRSTGTGFSPLFDTSNSGLSVFAKWSVAAVPIPATLPLALGGLGFLAFGRRMRRRAA